MNRTVAADFFQLLSLPGTLLFVVLQSNAAFTNSDTQRRKKISRKWMRANSAMFHLQPLTASTDSKGPLQHISSCVSLDLTVFALSSWVSCQPRGSGFDIKLIASVTQCVGYCEMLTPATCLILRRSCILQTTGSQEISERWFCSVCVLGCLKVKRIQYIKKNTHFRSKCSWASLMKTPRNPSLLYLCVCVLFTHRACHLWCIV